MDLLMFAIPMLLCTTAFGVLQFAKRVALTKFDFANNDYLFINQQITPPVFRIA